MAVVRNGMMSSLVLVIDDSGCVYKMKFTGIPDPHDHAQQPQTWRVDPKGEFYGFDNHGGPQVDGPWQKNWFNVHGIFKHEFKNR